MAQSPSGILATNNVLNSITRQAKVEPFDLHVSRNLVYGHRYVFKFGVCSNTQTAGSTIWNPVTPGFYAYPASATLMQVSSSSANDTNSSGTGARSIIVYGLDANYNEISETVLLNGQTQVATTKSYLRINDAEVLTVGSNTSNVGTIYIGTGSATSGVPATAYGIFAAGYNQLTQSVFTVPAGYTAYISSYTFSSAATTTYNVSGFFVTYQNSVPIIQASARMISGGNFDRHFDYPLVYQEKTDMELRASSSTAGVLMTGDLHILLIKNSADSGN
jgi:hypothetical protein